MNLIFYEFFRAVTYLFIASIVYFSWNTARKGAREKGLKKALWQGLLWCIGTALFASLILGSPTCEERSDPVYGGCERYADDGYEPTNNQRVANFIYLMTLLYVPVVFGAYKGNSEGSVK